MIRNVQSAIMLLCWLPDIQSKELQIWLAEHLCTLSSQKQNKMNCCNEGMISAIIKVLGRQKQIDPKAVGRKLLHVDSLESVLSESILNSSLFYMLYIWCKLLRILIKCRNLSLFINCIFSITNKVFKPFLLFSALLINLLETLGTHSITAIELKQLMGHLKLDEEENQV